jgi:hypothetical protein
MTAHSAIMTKRKIVKSMTITSLSEDLDGEEHEKVTGGGQQPCAEGVGGQHSGELGLQDNSF